LYTILINKDDTITASVRENIMHRTSMVNKLHILTDPIYQENGMNLDMRNFTCVIEYVLPVTRKYIVEVLTPSEELYKDKLEYFLPIDTRITSEPGDVAYKFQFTKLEMAPDGSFIERSRLTSSSVLQIIPVERWDDYIASDDLSSIAQMIMANQSLIEQQKLYAEMIYATKADSIEYDKETNKLSLIGNGNELDSVTLEECDMEDGIPVVDFSVVEPEQDDEVNNVVEF
jgi:hypothetical protein